MTAVKQVEPQSEAQHAAASLIVSLQLRIEIKESIGLKSNGSCIVIFNTLINTVVLHL